MDRLDGMAAFVAVVEGGSFTAAAARLDLSRVLVGKRVAALEDELGILLLNRTTRRVALTSAGTGFLARCRNILADYQEAASAIQNEQAEVSGLLKFNAPMSFGTLHLAAAVSDFMAAYHSIKVQMILSDRFVDLVGEGFDVGVRIGALKDSSIIARPLAPARLVVCASPEFVRVHGSPAFPADLVAFPCLHYGTLATENQWHFIGPGGLTRVRIDPVLSANNGEVLLKAALGGLGLALLPTFICGADIQTGRLVRLLPGFEPPEVAIHAIWPSNRLMPRKVRCFIDFLADRFSGQPYWDLLS